MGIDNPETWLLAEKECFDYLTGAMGETEGVKSFRGGLPVHAYNVWYFEINGPSGALLDADINDSTPGGCGFWNMACSVRGRFFDRDDALLLGGWLRTKLPTVENSFAHVRTFKPVGAPSVSIVPFDFDGKSRDIHEFEWTMAVIMKKSDAEKGI